MWPSKRFWVYWVAIIGALYAPVGILDWVGYEQWKYVLCGDVFWYRNLETALGVLPASVIHSFYWLGRDREAQADKMIALAFILHGALILPGTIIIWVGFHIGLVSDPLAGFLFPEIDFVFLAYWIASAHVIARLECLWPHLAAPPKSPASIGDVFGLWFTSLEQHCLLPSSFSVHRAPAP